MESSKDIKSLEAEVLVKVDDGNWYVDKNYSTDNLKEYTVNTYGYTHIQLNIRDKNNPYLIQRVYVGQIDVKASYIFLEKIELEENRLVFDIGESINIIPVSSKYNINELEFSILGRYNDEDWRVIQDYKKLPLSSIELDREGFFNICLKVRDPKDNSKYQITSGIQIAVAEFEPSNVENLMRILISNYSIFSYDTDEIYDIFSKELNVLGHLFTYQSNNEDVKKHIKDINNILNISKMEKKSDSEIIYFDNPKGMLKSVDIKNKIFLYNKQYISYKLEDYPTIEKVLESVKEYSQEVKVISIYTHLVYNHYRYNNVPGGNEKHDPLYSIDGHCLQLSDFLYELLAHMGYSVRRVSGEIGPYGGHSVVEFKDTESIYTLDPTLNIIYPRGVKELKYNNECIVFPQIYNRYFTWENDSWSYLENVYIWKTNDNWEGNDI